MKLLPLLCLPLLCLPFLLSPVLAQDTPPQNGDETPQSFTTIKTVAINALSNGVQIRIVADGLLQFQRIFSEEGDGKKLQILFPGAKNGTSKNFWNVNKYPLSHLQAQTPQGAKRGIGLLLTVNTFMATGSTLAATPDGQGVLITLRSDRTVEGTVRPSGADTATKEQEDGKPKTEVRFESGLVFLHAVRADIHSLIAQIARQTKTAVAVDDAINRTVSLNLSGVTPEEALKAIATANGLALSPIGGIIMLSEGVPTDLATYRLSGTQSYRMQNTQSSVVSGLLPNFLSQYLNNNPEQNAVVVTAPSQMLAKIGKDLNRLDTPSPQIEIEAVVVEFSSSSSREFGLSVLQQRSTSVTTGDSVAGAISYSTIGKLPQSFDATLKALEFSGKARVRARPKMALVNGKSASLFIGAQRFIQTQFNSFGGIQTRIQPVDVGVKLALTALTGGNGEITTTLSPEVSNITELDLQTGLPVLSTRRADTTVRVKDGETIAIGGLTLNQDQMTNRKVPFFGDLPLVGFLFRSEKRDKVQTELVIFVTPRILTGVAPTPK